MRIVVENIPKIVWFFSTLVTNNEVDLWHFFSRHSRSKLWSISTPFTSNPWAILKEFKVLILTLVKREENYLNILFFVGFSPCCAKPMIFCSLVPNVIVNFEIVIELSATLTPWTGVYKENVFITFLRLRDIFLCCFIEEIFFFRPLSDL